MSAQHPNHLKLQRGEVVAGADFGSVRSVNPVNFPGFGHSPHLEARFEGGVRIDWTPAALITFLRMAQEALAKLPMSFDDIADFCGGE